MLTWDDQRGNWDIALSTQTPFFMLRPGFTSLRTPATWLYVLMGFFILFSVLSIATDIEQVYLASEIDGGRQFSEQRLDDSNAVAGGMRGLQILAILTAAPLLIWWTYRATANLPGLGAESLEVRPRWSIWWWLIPVANFVLPARVLNQAWQASDPTLPDRPSNDWRSRKEDLLTIAWWPACVAAYFAWNVVLYQWDSSDLDDPARGAWAAGLIAVDVVLIALAALGILVVARLTKRQQLANLRFDPPPSQATSVPQALAHAAP